MLVANNLKINFQNTKTLIAPKKTHKTEVNLPKYF